MPSSVSLCSSAANATPAFEGRGGEALATSISRLLARSYSSTEALDLSKYLLKISENQQRADFQLFYRLCVLAGASCWVLYVDVLVLEMGGKDEC